MKANTIEHDTGEDVVLYFEVEDAAQDVTGADIHFGLYDAESGALVLEKATGDGIVIDGPRNYAVDLADGSSYNLDPGGYRYAVRITGPVGMRSVRSRGPYNVKYEP